MVESLCTVCISIDCDFYFRVTVDSAGIKERQLFSSSPRHKHAINSKLSFTNLGWGFFLFFF